MIRPVRWKCLFFLSLLFCLELGCGGGGGSQGSSSDPQNPAPTLSGISPNSAAEGSAALTLTASGSGFVPASVIEWKGAALATTFASSTSLSALIPASDLSSTGTASVVVQNPAPGGVASGALSFTISTPPNPTPTITSLSPSSATAGGPAFTLTVTGTQFISGSQVLWNGSQAPTTFASSTSLFRADFSIGSEFSRHGQCGCAESVARRGHVRQSDIQHQPARHKPDRTGPRGKRPYLESDPAKAVCAGAERCKHQRRNDHSGRSDRRICDRCEATQLGAVRTSHFRRQPISLRCHQRRLGDSAVESPSAHARHSMVARDGPHVR